MFFAFLVKTEYFISPRRSRTHVEIVLGEALLIDPLIVDGLYNAE